MSIHEGHRQRLRSRFRAEGLDNFDERHVLELLLFYALPRVDTAPLAQALLDHFQSLSRVLEASAEELEQVPGVGQSVSTLLTLTTQVGKYYRTHQNPPGQILNTVDKCGKYMVPYFHGQRQERVYLLCLDAKCKVLCCREVSVGSVNTTAVSIRRVVEMALSAGASSVVLAHNHPSGLAIPSEEDLATTMRLEEALDFVEIRLVDHFVVAGEDFVSIAQSKDYRLGHSRWADRRI